MDNQSVFKLYKPAGSLIVPRPVRSLLEILVVFVPLGVCGALGQLLGLKTTLSGLVINLGYVLSILTATFVLKRRGSGWRDIGLARPKSWAGTFALAVATFVVAILVMNLVGWVIANLPGMDISPPDISRFNPLAGNLPLLLGVLALVWTSNAFGEEMFYRAFLTSRLAEVFGNTRVGWVLAAIGSSMAFGLAHYGEGIAGIFTNGSFGLLSALVYVRTNRNLWITVIAHGLLNTVRFVILYMAG